MKIANDAKQNHHLSNPHHSQIQNRHITNPDYPSQCYQQTVAAISNFNNSLIILVESVKQLSEEESVNLFSSLESLKNSVSFVNKYFAEVVLKD
ncbi:MAG: hypothetical protein V4612_06735 [Pseudomonadota bacterium]